ncbi:hypothetical protein [Archangium lansingense]|uniref:Lipoprotein n=1 Tax=Archangium lansingense TaxID=2995310 RepID=A0ABT3ZX56_9BACT|nr:hypothetical protein [Archangium lansinium]MCY1073639.1 hypothetical protein [Archangium lansinium]
MVRVIPGLLLGAALLTGCGPEGRCEGTLGGTRIDGTLDGDSSLVIVPTTFHPEHEGAYVRTARLQLFYGNSDLRVITEVKLPAEQAMRDIPLGLSEEEWSQRMPQEGAVSIWHIQAPADAPELSGGTFSVRHADANDLEGKIDARFEDGSRLECTYDIRGQNFVPGDDPTYNGPP